MALANGGSILKVIEVQASRKLIDSCCCPCPFSTHLSLQAADIADQPKQTQHSHPNPEAHVENKAEDLGILVEQVDHIGSRCLQHRRHSQHSHSNDDGDLDVITIVEGVTYLVQFIVEDGELFELMVNLVDAADVQNVETFVFANRVRMWLIRLFVTVGDETQGDMSKANTYLSRYHIL